MLEQEIKNVIRDVPNFPKEGILFKDITPILLDALLCEKITLALASKAREHGVEAIAGVESRGFFFGMTVARMLQLPFIPIRKAGKLPGAVIKREYGLEYGSDSLEMQIDSLSHVTDPKILVIDDVLATGGTLIAALELIADLAGEVCEVAVLLEISALGGRERINAAFPNLKIRSLVQI